MAKAARRILVTLACIVVLLVAGMFLLESQWARAWLEDQVSQRLNGRNVEIGSLNIDWGWPLTAHLEEITIANPDWAPHDRMVDIEALEVAVNPGALLTGQIELQRLGLSQPVIHLARREDGTSNWGALTDNQDQQSGGGLGISPDIVRVDDGHLTYRDPNLEADLSVDFHTRSGDGGSRELMIEAQGRFQGLPLELSGHGGSPSEALAGSGDNAYPVTLQGHLGQLQASFDGRLRDVSQPASLEGQLAMSAPQTANLAAMLGRPQLELPSLDVQGRISHQDRQWSFKDATARLGETQVQGSVSVSLAGERPEIDAQLQADRLDLSHWGLLGADGQAPADQESTSSDRSVPWDQQLAQKLAPLQNYDAQFDLAVGRLAYADTALHDVTLKGSLEQGTLTVQRLHAAQDQAQDQGQFTAQGQVDIRDDTLSADLEAQLSQLDMDAALAPLGYDGLGTWDGQLDLQLPANAAEPGNRPQISAQLDIGHLNLTQLGVLPQDDQSAASGDSQEEMAWDRQLAEQLAPLRRVDAQVDLTVDRLSYGDSQLNDIALQGSLDAGTVDIERLHATQDQGELTAQGQVDIREKTLTADLEAQLSQVDMDQALAPLGYGGLGTWNGKLGLQLPPNAAERGNRPTIDAQLDIDHLDLAQLGVTQGADEETAEDGETPGDSAAWDRDLAEGLEPLRRFNAQADLSIGRLSYGNTQLRNVALQGSLEAGRLDVQNLHLDQDRGALTAQGVLNIQAQTLSGDIDAQLSRFDLGEALAPLGSGDLGMLDGRLHVRLEDGELVADDTTLDYRLPSQDLFLHINADTIELAGASVPGVRLQGYGRHNGESFEYDLQVGPLLNLRDPDKPYPVQGQITSDRSRLIVDGTIEKPLELGRIQTAFELSGPNPARLNALTELNLPALPPYELQGELRVRDDLVRMLNLDGTFGDSDVSGDVRLRLGERNMLWATLHSQQLDLDDLAPLTGSPPETGSGEAASPAQQARALQEEERQGLFPDREWNLQGLRNMDAEVRYSADNVDSEYVPLSNVSLDLSLENGVLTLEPLRMGLGGGTVLAQLRLDAHGQVLDGSLDLSARQVNLKPILRRAGAPEIAEDSAGTLGGQGQVRFAGDSMDELMASLDGRLEMAMSGGRLDMLLMEGVGLDVGEGLIAALADADKVPMQCAYTRLAADSGIAAVEQFFISTVDSNITGGGEIDLDRERLELVFEAHPKDPSLLASDSPIRVQGPITSPQIGVVSRELIARGVLSVLGAVVAPPLAVLPWVEPGLGEGVGPGCRQVLDESRAQAASEN
ncbi:AsmA family protein [Halomonas sp. McH1-25]|uniref:AsmA family protein n=1 Tax=unclassified Halomonas TaxID=2609666 RepID=UPI001EF61287|nr:AsmA family protein [Halomonas sp. McH1-25]MCP1341982.1 AsmA family protein [Halomonas sp. FL8]MCP1363134.1 AsmA family protein [Halomonas sp. BBD45]